MIKNEDLRKWFDTSLVPILEPFEEERKKYVKNMWIFCLVVLISTGVVWFVNEIFVMVLVLIIGVALVLFYVHKKKEDFRERFKLKIIPGLIEVLDFELQYDPKTKVDQEKFKKSDLFRSRIDVYKGEDYFQGKAGQTQIEFSELLVQRKEQTRNSKGNTQTKYITIFRGLFFIADFNKHFNGTTIVVPDQGKSRIGKWFEEKVTTGKRVSLEDPEFEKLFEAYSTDEIEARYILTPSFMSRMVEYRKKIGNRLRCSFSNQNLNMAVEIRRNLFEPHFFSNCIDFEMIQEFYEDLRLIVETVEDLNLNLRIWTKQ
jgi:hypothetical protein